MIATAAMVCWVPPGDCKIGGQMTQAVYKITVLEKYGKMNDQTETLTVASGVTAKPSNLSLADSVDRTYVWTCS
jgi:hypothetical protein